MARRADASCWVGIEISGSGRQDSWSLGIGRLRFTSARKPGFALSKGDLGDVLPSSRIRARSNDRSVIVSHSVIISRTSRCNWDRHATSGCECLGATLRKRNLDATRMFFSNKYHRRWGSPLSRDVASKQAPLCANLGDLLQDERIDELLEGFRGWRRRRWNGSLSSTMLSGWMRIRSRGIVRNCRHNSFWSC